MARKALIATFILGQSRHFGCEPINSGLPLNRNRGTCMVAPLSTQPSGLSSKRPRAVRPDRSLFRKPTENESRETQQCAVWYLQKFGVRNTLFRDRKLGIGVPAPAESERVAPVSSGRNWPVPRVGANVAVASTVSGLTHIPVENAGHPQGSGDDEERDRTWRPDRVSAHRDSPVAQRASGVQLNPDILKSRINTSSRERRRPNALDPLHL